MDKQCEQCHKIFRRVGKSATTARFCSIACKSLASGAVNKTCEVCAKTYRVPEERAATARFCSRTCKGIKSRLPKNKCVVCGNIWQPGCGKKEQPTCSRACGAKMRKTGTIKQCEICQSGFYVRITRSVARFCGKACADAWQSRNKDSYTCKICKTPFQWSPSRKGQGNPTYCGLKCRDADPARATMLIEMNVAQAKLRPNNLERAAYALLDTAGVDYERQHLIGRKFCVDAFVPAANLVIQFDGDYWHGNPDKFPKPDARQQRRMKLDASQDAYMAACGYRVLRIWECHIKTNPEQVVARVLTTVASRLLLVQPRLLAAVEI